ncbi:MAG: T9SS type A sorting domain-containing protein [Tannerella sp.]|nr:T9SS type A sorting domain-containing protein [Tannerella sp.]
MYITIYWYPTANYLDTNIRFKLTAEENKKDVYGENRYFSLNATNPVNPPTINSFTYNANGSSTINYAFPGNVPVRDADYASAGQTNWADLGTFGSGASASLTSGALTVANVTNGWKLRAWHKWPAEDIGLVNGITYSGKKMEYLRFSAEYNIAPIKLPTNPGIEDKSDGKVLLTWDVNTTTQHTQAGNVLIYVSANKPTVAKKKIAEVDYKIGKYEYDLTSLITPDNKSSEVTTFTFTFYRIPFSEAYAQTNTYSRNMHYRKATLTILAKSGNNGIYLEWKNDNGFYKNAYKYRLVATQGTKTWSPIADIDITASSKTIDITDAGFSTCNPITVKLQMVEGNDVKSTSNEMPLTISEGTNNSEIEALSVSKGYYTDRVRLNWAVNKENEFVRYLVYRREFENVAATPVLVATVSHLAGVTTYNIEDMQIQPGVFYTYSVEGQKDCGGGTLLNTIYTLTDEGYVQPYGTVSGRVTYAAGTAVKGVTVSAEGTSELQNKAMDFTPSNDTYISTLYKAGTLDPNHFSFQAWVKLRPYDPALDTQSKPDDPPLVGTDTKRQQFLYAMGKYNITLWDEGQLALEHWTDKGVIRASSDIKISSGEYHHITVTFAADAANKTTETVFYLDGVPRDTLVSTDVLPASFSTGDSINFGRNVRTKVWRLNGYMDEVRLWTTTLTADEIKGNYNAYISGKEDGLSLYYRFDETASLGRVFDLSGRSGKFNENHGRIYGTVQRTSTEIPSTEQLAIKAITDANGYYEINTIPYSADGNSYIITPALGVHSFDPINQQPRFQPGSSVKTIDFKDISSFTVKGKVLYDGEGTGADIEDRGTYPVEGCSFTVDGKTLVHPNGLPVLSESNGDFEIEVPIGIHEVKVVKTGHQFADGGRLLEQGKDINYFDHKSGVYFLDQTRVKLVGRVVGGKREHAKPLGFGESVNNIGVQTIQLIAAKQGSFNKLPGGVNDTIIHNNGEWKKTDALRYNLNDTTKVNITDKTVTITISPETGEFVAYLPPEMYEIQKIKTLLSDDPNATETEIFQYPVQLDLTALATDNKDLLKKSIRTWTDSVQAVVRPGELPHKVAVEHSDTITYNEEWKFFYQGVPTFGVTQLDGKATSPYFGDKEIIQQNPITAAYDTIQLAKETDPDTYEYLFGLPVFQQAGEYTFGFEAFERYINYRNGNEDIMPVTTGEVQMSNDLRIGAAGTDVITLDSLGKGTYTFVAGVPDMTTGILSFQAILSIDGVGYYWDLPDPSGQDAILLGAKSTGNDFITAGPDKVDFIVHDPPGTSSYGFIEKGATVTKTTSYSLNGALGLGLTGEISLGAKVVTFVGIGAGIITAAEAKLKVTDELKEETTYKHGNEKEETITVTERIETSAASDYVGHAGDVFVGNSTNALYGWVNAISPVRLNKVEKPENVIIDLAGNDPNAKSDRYVIAKTEALAYGEEFDTRFAFTEYELENIMIPKWKANRELLLRPQGYYSQAELDAITSPVYVSYLETTHPNYGKLNTDITAFGSKASKSFDDGESYKIYFPKNYDGILGNKVIDEQLFKITFVDSVAWYYQNIQQWEDRLADNEKEKVEMVKLGNYSFGGGGAITRSELTSAKQTKSNEWNIVLTNTFSEEAGAEFSGVGASIKGEIVTTFGYGGTDNTLTENSKTVGFVLKEEGTTDELTVDYGQTAGGGIAFNLRGGRTSCPYEGEVRTKYYQPGQHVLSSATWKVEDPKLSVEGSVYALRVPAIRPASYNLELKNESETGNDGYFQIVVGENTNPDGAIIKIDGLPIGNGRSFTVPSGVGNILKKNLTIEKGPVKDEYKDIAIILQSQCETSLADTVLLNVEFIPSSSDIAFKTPSDRWILNTITGDTLNIVLNKYDVNYANFGHVELQYHSTASADWKSIWNFYADSTRYKASTNQSTSSVLQASDTEINYKWNTKDIVPDGTYELRARTVCETIEGGSGGFISDFTTDPLTGTKDMSKPTLLGRPSPVNGILTASDELSILFNEDIQSGLLQNKLDHFSIKGVLNAAEIAIPDAGLSFDGTTGVAHTELPLYTDGSFTLETWFKRTSGKAGTLFAYGEGVDYLSLGFDKDGHAKVSVGSDTITSTNAIADDATWKYIALVYNRESNKISVYEDEGIYNNILIQDAALGSFIAPVKGKLYAGNNAKSDAGFDGAVARLHFYTDTRSQTEISSSKSLTKSGTEVDLAGYWELDESEGTTAKDKARSRHLRVNTSWYVYPQGYAVAVNDGTTGEYISADVSANSFTINDDFTLEFWFKGVAQAATLFSCDSAVSITSDATGKLFLHVGTAQQALTQTSVLNNEWHHFALSVKRNSTTTTYIDGVAATQFNSSIIKEVGGLFTYGAKRTVPNTVPVYGDYFTGRFDEIRVWASALTGESVKLNKNSKLYGTEKGLIAYYPFETYIKQTNGLVTVTADLQDMVDNTLTATAPAPTDNAPALKDVRPVVSVPFDYVVSNNKIVFTLKEELYKMEGVTLELAAWDILDLRGNISNIEKWTAYVNLNSLKWATDAVNLVISESETPTFKATISNNSGLKTDYYIDNIPEWLTVTASQGTLNQLEKKDLTFQVRSGVNIGSYEAAVVLRGVNGVREILPVTLKVMGQKPDWSVNPKEFTNSMTVTGQVQILGAYQEDEDDIIGVFIGDLCVGLASPRYINEINAYYTFISVYGNAAQKNQPLVFKLWDASTGRIYPVVESSIGEIKFAADKMYGTPSAPIVLNAVDITEQSIAMNTGWNWISSNQTNANPTILSQMKILLASVGEMIKGRSDYLEAPTYAGVMPVTEKEMYQIKVKQDYTMVLKGTLVNPLTTLIPLSKGWNWIGYTPAVSMNVKEALAGINAKHDDMIKSQGGGYMQYMNGTGWMGTLASMNPGSGYMYYSNETAAKTFYYPNASSIRSLELRNGKAPVELKWTPDPRRFSGNMTVTAIVLDDETEVHSDLVEIAAFVGDECRGSVLLQYYEGLAKPYLGFLTIYGEAGDKLSFKVYDHGKEAEYAANGPVSAFTANGIYGNPLNPSNITFNSATGNEQINAALRIYPNPVKDILYLEHGQSKLDLLEISDITGKSYVREVDFAEKSLRVSKLEAGVYILKVIVNGQTSVHKFIKQ